MKVSARNVLRVRSKKLSQEQSTLRSLWKSLLEITIITSTSADQLELAEEKKLMQSLSPAM